MNVLKFLEGGYGDTLEGRRLKARINEGLAEEVGARIKIQCWMGLYRSDADFMVTPDNAEIEIQADGTLGVWAMPDDTLCRTCEIPREVLYGCEPEYFLLSRLKNKKLVGALIEK